MEFLRPDYDVIIVGARCAGAATALNLARGGARVLVIDRDRPGSDTLSTHAILRAGVMLLDRWGVLPALVEAGTPVIRRTVFQYGADAVSVQIRPQGGAAGLYAPRRSLLDRALVEAARGAGAEIRHGLRCRDVLRDMAGRVTGIEILDAEGATRRVGAGLVIGADGRNSTLAALVGAETYRRGRHRSATLYGHFAAPPQDAYRWVFQPGIETGAIPTNDGQVCIFASVPPDRFRATFGDDPLGAMRRILGRSDEALADLVAAGPADGLRRFGGAFGYFRQSFGPGWALVGDAGYFKDPATAHGITDALRDAELLSRAILTGGEAAMAGYQATRDAMSDAFFEITDRIAALDWSMDELQALHLQLNESTRAEQAYVAGDAVTLAA